jgi:hypothetical protein
LLGDAFDTEQLLKCMGQLKHAQPVNVAIYMISRNIFGVLEALGNRNNVPVTHKIFSICNFIL